MRALLLLISAVFTGCAAYQRAVVRDLERHGRCELVCDAWAKQIGQNAAAIWYLQKEDRCRCWSPLTPWERDSGRPVIVEIPAPKLGDAL